MHETMSLTLIYKKQSSQNEMYQKKIKIEWTFILTRLYMLLTTNKEHEESLDPAVQQTEQNGNYNLTSQYF
jgi:hypothetical protein